MSSLSDLPEVVGFFSYSREDDESYKGRLSALREGIQDELGAQLGRSKTSFRLWQDKEAIAPGKLWQSEIKTAVEQSVFFIPIVTPRAVSSDYCKFEFEAFLAREHALGRADLVFPILYVPVPALANEAQWRNHLVLSAIARRQYVDWQTFRYSDVDTPAPREAIARFCRKIVEALDQSWLSPEERKQIEEAEAQRKEEEEQRQKEAQAKRRDSEEARVRKDAAEAQEQQRRKNAEAEAERQRLEREAAATREAEERSRQTAAAEAERQRQERDAAVTREAEGKEAEAKRLAADERARKEKVAEQLRTEGERRQTHDETLAARQPLAQQATEVGGQPAQWNAGHHFVGAFLLLLGALCISVSTVTVAVNAAGAHMSSTEVVTYAFALCLVVLLVSGPPLAAGVGTIKRKSWARVFGLVVCVIAAIIGGGSAAAALGGTYLPDESYLYNVILRLWLLVLVIVCASAAIFYLWGWRSGSWLSRKIPHSTSTFFAFVLFFDVFNILCLPTYPLFQTRLDHLWPNELYGKAPLALGLLIIIESLVSFYCFRQFWKEFSPASSISEPLPTPLVPKI